MGRVSFSSVQAIIGVVASMTSITGAVYSAVQYGRPAHGEIAAVVRDARTRGPVPDATVEILTTEDALVTTVAPGTDGWARYSLAQGAYRVRASHPGLEPEVRRIEVRAGHTAEVRFQLAQAPQSASAGQRGRGPVDGAARAVKGGVGAAQRFLHGLGL